MTIGTAALGQVAIGQLDPLNRTLSAGLVTNTSVFYSPTVIFDQTITQSAIVTNSQAFYAPAVTSVAYLIPGLIANTSYFFQRAGLWNERQEQAETWIERTEQSEDWTRAA